MRRGFGGFRHGGFGYRGFGYPIYRMGFGGPSLLTSLMAGGLGYLLGSSTANQPVQQVPVYQQPQAAPPTNATQDNGMLNQLKMLSDLHNSGALTDDEFVRAKNRLFGG